MSATMAQNPVHESGIDPVLPRLSAQTSETTRYDYCFVFPVDKNSKSFTQDGAKIMSKLIKCGLVAYQYYSVQKDEIYVLVRADLGKLAAFADVIDYRMLLDKNQVREALERGDAEKGIAPINIAHDPEVTEFLPFEYIYAKYSVKPELQSLYWKPKDLSHPFRESIRLKLTLLLIEAAHRDGGAGLSLRRLLKQGHILSYFPLHDNEAKASLELQWMSWFKLPSSMPYDDLKEYFGEKIGLYFKFLGHYTAWLIVPAIIGLIFQLVVAGTGDFSSPVIPFYSLYIALWAIFMLEFWKRTEKITAMKWGTIGFEDEQRDRPEFEGQTRVSFINGSQITYFPPHERSKIMAQSFSIIGTLALIVLGAVSAIYVIRRILYDTDVSLYAQFIASIANSVQITIFNIIYGKLADYLTDMENHRTDTQFEDSMIAKLFIFQFVNSYSSFFYLAFVAKYLSKPPGADEDVVGECGYSDCMVALAINLGIIFGIRLTLSNFLEIAEPYIKSIMRLDKETKGTEGVALSVAEKEFLLEPYDQLKGVMNDYAELAIQFGYMTFFISALPAASFAAFINNYVEIRTDGYKLLQHLQRPHVSTAEDIGTWMTVFQVMATICVVTNSGLIVFTMSVLDDYDLSTRMWLFIAFQWFLFGTQSIIQIAIPDEPYEVQIQAQRNEFIVDKIIEKVEDDLDGESLLSKAATSDMVSFKINDTEPLVG